MLCVRAAFGWALRLGVVGSTGGWRRLLGEQRVRFRAERLLRIAWLAGALLADIVLLAWALPQMAQLTTLYLSGTTSPALCALIVWMGCRGLGMALRSRLLGLCSAGVGTVRADVVCGRRTVRRGVSDERGLQGTGSETRAWRRLRGRCRRWRT